MCPVISSIILSYSPKITSVCFIYLWCNKTFLFPTLFVSSKDEVICNLKNALLYYHAIINDHGNDLVIMDNAVAYGKGSKSKEMNLVIELFLWELKFNTMAWGWPWSILGSFCKRVIMPRGQPY